MAELIDFGSKITYSNESPMRWGSEQAISGANKIRDFNRQRAVENAVSKNYDPKTLKIDENGIAQDLASKGFGGTAEQVINQLKAERTKMSSDVADAIGKDYNLIGMKIMTPQRFIEKWGNSTEATAMVDELKSQIAKTDAAKQATQPVSDIPVQTVSEMPVKKTALDDLKQKFPTSFKFTPKDAVSDTYVETPSENVVSVDGSGFVSKAEEAKLPDIIPETKYEVKTNKPTTTTQYLAIDTTPEKLASMFPEIGSTTEDIAKSSFSSEGMNQSEKDNLNRFLAREGKVVKGESLEDAVARYENDKIAAVPKPVPPQPGKNPIEERARYYKERSEYDAKVAEAINQARKEIRLGYAEVQGTTLAAQGGELAKRADARAAEAEKRAKEDQEFRLAKQKNDIFVRKVSEPEAEKVYKITDEYEDIAEAAINPNSFESAWGAAVSLAKLDGNITLDNVTNYLIGMKAFPTRDVAELKRELGPSIDWYNRASEEGLARVRDAIGTVSKSGTKPKGADAAYIKRQLEKWNKIVIKNGGKPMPTDFNTTSSSGSTTSTTPASTEPQKSGAKAQADKIHEDARAKAAAKKGSAKPNPRGTVD